jgi:hypothetical protein
MKECLPSSELSVNELIYFTVQYNNDDNALKRQRPVMYLDLDAWRSILPSIDSLPIFHFLLNSALSAY